MQRDRAHALLALILIAPAPSVGVILANVELGDLGLVLWGAAKVWLFGLPLAWHLAVDRQPLSWSPPRRGGFGVAAAVGLVMAGAIVAAYFLVGRHIEPQAMREQAEAMRLTEPAVYIAAALFWITINALLEEYVYRWFIFSRAEALMPGRAAVLVAALIFVVHHAIAMAGYLNWWMTAAASAAIFVAAAAWSALYLRYRSVWVPWLSHAIADAAIFLLGWRIIFA